MNENLQVALIAGSISLIVSGIGFLSSLFVTKTQSRQFENQLRSQQSDKLISLRLEHYPQAFTITEKIQRRKEPQRIIPRKELQAINYELQQWKNGIVGLILSHDSITSYYNLLEVLGMGYAEKDGFTREQADKIISARDDFRRSLRQDVGFLHVGSPRLEKNR
jgi:hypothetical protein